MKNPAKLDFPFWALALLLVIFLFGLISLYRQLPLFPSNPNSYAAEMSLWISQNWSLEYPEHYQFYDKLVKLSRDNLNVHYCQDVIGVSSDGSVHLARGILYALAASPFAYILGEYGLLLLNQFLVWCVLISSFRIVKCLSNERAGLVICVLLLMGTHLLDMSFGFSYDLFATFLIVVGFSVAGRFPTLGVVLMMASFESRPSNVFFAFTLPWAWLYRFPCKRQTVKRILFGWSLGALLILLWNWYFWGNVFYTGYTRFPAFLNGEMIFDHAGYLPSFSVLFSDWGIKLFGLKSGILRHNFALLLYFISIPLLIRHVNRWSYIIIAAVVMIYSLFVFSIPIWSQYDNACRYLTTAIVLAVIQGSCSVEMIGRSIRVFRARHHSI